MRKIFNFVLIGLLVAGLFVSCSSDVENEQGYGTCSANFDIGNSKGLDVSLDFNLATSGTNGFYWKYTAVKQDSYGKEGEKTIPEKFKASGTGLDKLTNLSTGKWKFTLFAYLDSGFSKLVYEGSLETTLQANTENSLSVNMNRKQTGANGTLYIDPAKIHVAADTGVAIVSKQNGDVYYDSLADTGFDSNKLDNYSYTVYECDDSWEPLVSGGTLATSRTDVVSKSIASGKHNIKIVFAKKDAGGDIAKGDDGSAEQYIACVVVNIYDYCTTRIEDGASNGGIVVRRLKEFKINYRNGLINAADATEATAHPQGYNWDDEAISPKPQHSNVVSDYSETGLEPYPQFHQYGRTELLDEPTRNGGWGFAGWYKDAKFTDGPYTSVPVDEYTDITYYAKWDSICYDDAGIRWDDNFPSKVATADRHASSDDGSSTGDTTTVYHLPSTEPSCKGYVFLGWYTTDEENTFNTSAGFPKPTKNKETVVVKAAWKVIEYKLHFDANGNASATVPADINAEYYLEDRIEEATSSDPNKVFLYWTSVQADTSETARVFDSAYNLTEQDGKIITLYAIWTNYIEKLDYVRAFASAQNSGVFIDSGVAEKSYYLNQQIRAKFEYAGNLHGTYQMVFGEQIKMNAAGLEGKLGGCGYNYYYDVPREQIIEFEGFNYNRNGQFSVKSGVEELTYTFTNASDAYNYNYMIFGAERGSGDKYYTSGRIYSLSLQQYSTKKYIRKFIPCRITTALPADKDSQGTARAVGTVGFWDAVSNKFYTVKNSLGGKVYAPDEEYTILFHSDAHEDTRQKMVYGITEKLQPYRNNKVNCALLGFVNTIGTNTPDYLDGQEVSNLAAKGGTKDLYVKWTIPISYHLFGQVDWIESTGHEVINLGVPASGNKKLTTEFMVFTEKTKAMGDAYNIGYGRGSTRHALAVTGHHIVIFGGVFDGYGYFGILDDRFRDFKDADGNYKDLYFCNRKSNNKQLNPHSGTYLTVELNNRLFDNKIKCVMVNRVSGNNEIYVDDASGSIISMNSDPGSSGAVEGAGQPFALFNENGTDIGTAPWAIVRFYSFKFEDALIDKTYADFIPCVLSTDLKAGVNVFDAGTGTMVPGNTKVFGGKNCLAGEAGMWDKISDMFYPNVTTDPDADIQYPTDIFKVRFDANGAKGKMADQNITATSTYARLSGNIFTNPGYEFVGWCDKSDGTGKWYSDGRGLYTSEFRNMTLFAQWRAIPATKPYIELDYLRNDPDGKAFINLTATVGTHTGKYIPGGKFRIDYKFACQDVSQYAIGGKENLGIGNVVSGKIWYGANSDAVSQAANTAYTVDIMSFDGAHVGYNYNDGSYVSKNVALSAYPNTPCLFSMGKDSTSLNQGTGKNTTIYYYKQRDSNDKPYLDLIPCILTEDIPASNDANGVARSKYTMGFWDKVDNKFFTKWTNDGYFINDEFTVVQYNANGGSGSMDDQAFKFGEEAILNKNVYTNGVKKFIGWNTKADGTGTWFCDEYKSSSFPTGFVALYAQWSQNATDVSTEYFEPVNYCKGDGYSVVETEIVDNSAYKINIKFKAYSGHSLDAMFGTVGNGVILYSSTSTSPSGAAAFNFGTATKTGATSIYEKEISAVLSGGNVVLTYPDMTTETLTRGLSSYTSSGRTYGVFFANTSDGVWKTGKNSTTEPGLSAIYNLRISNGGTKLLDLVPCRLTQKITSYTAGRLSGDGITHKVGEVGFWDLVENKFYGALTVRGGSFTCEFN